jgi:predicted GNAT family N-acyltransferase
LLTKLTGQLGYKVKPLEGEDRAAFHCGDQAIDKYFHERASRDMREKLAAVFILVPKEDPKTIVGFFTLSGQQTTCADLPEELRKKTGRYKVVGVTLLGRMGVAKEFQGQKHGRRVLFAALHEAWKATKHVMSFAVVVDAKSEDLVPFYEKYGFHRLDGTRLILPMKTVDQTIFRMTSSSKAEAATSAAEEAATAEGATAAAPLAEEND